MRVWEGLGMALPNQGLHFYAQVADLGGRALENFPKGGLGGPGMGGPGKISSSGPSIFCAGCVFAWGLHFRFFPRLVWEGALGHFPDHGPDFYAQGAHLRASWDKN